MTNTTEPPKATPEELNNRNNATEKPKRSKKTTKKDLKYTKFLYEFFETLPHGKTSAFMKNGNCRDLDLYYWYRADDAKLAKIMDVFAANGFDLNIVLKKKAIHVEDESTVLTIDKNIVFQAPEKTGKHLQFLKDFFDFNDISVTQLANKMNIFRTTVYAWFQTDNITLQNLYKVAEACDAKIYISIIRKNPSEK